MLTIYYKAYYFENEKLAKYSPPEQSILEKVLNSFSESDSQYRFKLANENQVADFIIINAYSNKQVYEKKSLNKILEGYRPTCTLDEDEKTYFGNNKNFKQFLPILLIFDLREFEIAKISIRALGFQYWDCSSWQRWVGLGDNYETDLKNTLADIGFYFQSKIYSEDSSKEFIEFITRIYKNSYIADYEEGDGEGHANYIVPFPFFQENEFRATLREGKDIKGIIDGNLKWSVLVIDDKANVKTSFIKSWMTHNFSDSTTKFEIDNHFEFTEALTKVKALELLKIKKFDIIMLDYLLDKEYNERNLGIHILEELQNNTKVYKKSIDNKFWIYPITAFPSAFIDHIREKKIPLNNESLTISRGADPLNTPYAFLYSFFDFLKIQLSTIDINVEYPMAVLWKNELKNLKSDNSIREWASKVLGNVLFKKQTINELLNLKESLLAQSLSKSYKIDCEEEKSTYEYLSHLLFLLAFQDGYEWEEMITSFRLIQSVTSTQEDAKDQEIGMKKIVDYIAEQKKSYDN
jgi:hypothetical protein